MKGSQPYRHRLGYFAGTKDEMGFVATKLPPSATTVIILIWACFWEQKGSVCE